MNQMYMLPVGEDKAGDFTCSVTIGTAVSPTSVAKTIAATGF